MSARTDPGREAPGVAVVTAVESAARDRAAIASGVPSRALMQRAGAAAAAEIARRFADRLAGGVAIYAGPGNNGGDAWVVAAALATGGARVAVRALDPRTDDARAERAHALDACGAFDEPAGEPLVVDGVLGTGTTGRPRGEAGALVDAIDAARRRGAAVAALDVPSGVDATTGAAEGAVRADLTLTFGTVKRGLLVARAHAGTIVVLDIGLGRHAAPDDGAARLCDERWAAAVVPPIAPDAHKGTRRKLAILGGGPGMAGAAILAADAALRSGAGMVRVVAAPESVPAVQGALPAALASAWPTEGEEGALLRWADALLIGPGLGAGEASRALVERALGAFRGPVVLDADALNVFAGDAPTLAGLLGGRDALVTPHPVEFARLSGLPVERVLAEQFDVGTELAGTLGAAVLLKGVPTVVTAPGGGRLVSAAGTPALATAGSGDVLGGIATTLLAQLGEGGAARAGACAAWVHGRAGELATTACGGTRGTALADVLGALPAAWRDVARGAPASRWPVLAELPAVPA